MRRLARTRPIPGTGQQRISTQKDPPDPHNFVVPIGGIAGATQGARTRAICPAEKQASSVIHLHPAPQPGVRSTYMPPDVSAVGAAQCANSPVYSASPWPRSSTRGTDQRLRLTTKLRTHPHGAYVQSKRFYRFKGHKWNRRDLNPILSQGALRVSYTSRRRFRALQLFA